MTKSSIEQRLARLESQMASVLSNGLRPTTDWRTVVDKYAGDEGLLEILRAGEKIREADRRKARQQRARRVKVK